MSGMSYLAVVERYHQYRNALREQLSSILTGMGDAHCSPATKPGTRR